MAHIIVTYKPEANHPNERDAKEKLSEYVEKGIVSGSKTGKYFTVDLDPSLDDPWQVADEICRKLLANHVYELYSFELKPRHTSKELPVHLL